MEKKASAEKAVREIRRKTRRRRVSETFLAERSIAWPEGFPTRIAVVELGVPVFPLSD